MNEQELRVIITATIDELQKNVKKAQEEVEGFGKKSKVSFQDVNDSMQQVGGASKKALGVVAVSVAGAATALLALGASTKEYRNEQAKLTTAFEAAGGSAEQAKDTYNDLYRVLGDGGQATEAANHLAMLTTNEKDLAEWTNICQGVYATFGDSLPIESLTEAANETAKTGQLTGALADALNWAGVSEDDFQASLDACNTEAEREQKIRETLNGIYDDAAAKYEENNKEILAQNEANAKLEESMAKLGEAVAPISTMLSELATEVLAELTPYIQDFAEKHMPTIKEVLEGVAEAVGKVIGWIADHWELISTIGAVILGIATALSVVSTVMGIVNAVMAVSPVTWIILGIVAAIAAIVAIIVVLVKHWDKVKEAAGKAWDWIKGIWEKVATWFDENVIQPIVNFFSGLWESIKNIFNVVVTWFSNVFTNAWNGIKNAFSAVGSFFSGCWTSIKNAFSAVASWFGNIFKNAWNNIKSAFSAVGSFFSGIWDKITSIFSKAGTAIADAVSGAFKSAINWVLSKAISIINGFISAINFAIGIINKIPGVEIKKLNKLDVPQLAQGGVLKKGQVGLLEGSGAEAVVPLEKNTQWLDRIAERLNGNMGAAGPIIMQVDGKTFAEISINSINNLTRQRGSLPLLLG